MVWLTNWIYRKSHIVTAAAGAGTNYQVCIKVYYGSGTDGTETVNGIVSGKVYCNGYCKTDFGDIRFTTDDGETELSYWMEEKVDSNYAIFWIKIIDDLSTVNKTIYLYYGNVVATTTSNGTNTFLFFDDFSGDLSKWTVDSGTWTIISGELRHTLTNTEKFIHIAGLSLSDFAVEYKMRSNIKSKTVFGGLLFRLQDTTNMYRQLMYYTNDVPDLGMMSGKRVAGVDSNTFTAWSWVADTTYKMRVLCYGNTQKFYSTDYISNETTRNDVNWASGTIGLEGIYTSASGSQYYYFDDIRVRKYVSTEPSHGAWGNQSIEGWLTGWQYRKSHIVNAATGAGTNYQVGVKVYYGSGTDGTETYDGFTIGKVYASNHCQTDFDDVRFTTSNGETKLDYWLEKKVDSSYAIFWIEVTDDLSSYNKTIYIYYGNNSAISISNGWDTFLFFDNFNTVAAKYASNPVVVRGSAGQPDYACLRDSALIKVGSTYYLAYVAYSNPDASNNATICMAYSTDLINWTKMGVILSKGTGWESKYVCDPFIYYNSSDGTYYLFYCGGTTASAGGVPTLPTDIGVATNTDITDVDGWVKSGSNPIVSHNTQAGVDDLAVTSPCIYKDGSTYYMFYGAQKDGSSRGIGYATSPDLLTWTKYASNPVLAETENIENPTVWYDQVDERFYMGVNFINTVPTTLTDKNLIYYSSTITGWTTTKKKYLFGTSASGWDSVIIGSMAMDIDENGRLQHVIYDGNNVDNHYYRDLGLVTITWDFANLGYNYFDWTWTPSSRGGDSFSLVDGKLRIVGALQNSHDIITLMKCAAPVPTSYIQEMKMIGTWDTNYKVSGLYVGAGGSAKASDRVLGQVMHESSGSPHDTVWVEKMVSSTRTVPSPIVRFTEPSFPATIIQKFIKNGTTFSTKSIVDDVTVNGTDISYTSTATYLGIVCNNDNNANTFTCDFDDYRVRKYVSPEPSHSIWGTEESIEVTITYDTDVIFAKLGITDTDSIDTIFKKLDITTTYVINTIYKKLNITKTDSIDVLLNKLGLTKTESIDLIFKKLDITKNDSIDIILKKLGIPLIYSVDVDFVKLKLYNIDLVLKKAFSKSYDSDVLLDNFLYKGRMNAVKESLINKITTYGATTLYNLTIIDAWRMHTYDFQAYNGNLVSIKIMPSRMMRLHYGSMITNRYFGQCYTYRFTLHILAKYVEVDGLTNTEPIHGKTAMNIANGIVNYLRQNQVDTDKGVLNIINITARESDPSGLTRGGAYMARIIVEGEILAERPYRRKEAVV